MRLLSLVRHAAAEPGTTLVDRERPLDDTGRHEAARMAQCWRLLGLVPDLIAASPAVRARETALAFAAAFGLDPSRIMADERLYLATPGDLLAVVHDIPSATAHLMVIGHNPGMSEFARALCPELPLLELPTAGCCTLRSSARSWRRIESSKIAVIACERP